MCEINTKHSLILDYCACSVEFNRENSKIFAVGLYELDKKDEENSKNNLRLGKVELFNYDNEQLTKLQSVETDGILDQKWNKNNLITANSGGFIENFKLNEASNELEKLTSLKLRDNEPDCLALSLDINLNSRDKVMASDSKGNISHLDMEHNIIINQWKAHDFEAWTVAFNTFNDSIIFSGGDDSSLKVWDMRENYVQIKYLKRNAGVTSLYQSNENCLLVGSYDENLCSYDIRKLKNSVAEIDLGGGIWRIKSSPLNQQIFIIACMYKNFSIVEFNNVNFYLLEEYNQHESICYGCDWSSINTVKDKNLMTFASCSFYDKKLNVCEVKLG
jgi:diphthine methyl ester acylhydrolase